MGGESSDFKIIDHHTIEYTGDEAFTGTISIECGKVTHIEIKAGKLSAIDTENVKPSFEYTGDGISWVRNSEIDEIVELERLKKKYE